MQKATQTLQKIDNCIASDQGNAYRFYLQQVIPHIEDAYRQDDSPFRSHLGASGIGEDCARAIWYSFRWATVNHFDGRILRLFNRGHLEEARFIAMLLQAGIQVYQQDENGHQYRISDAGGHFGGSGDGIGVGVPELPQGQPCLLEMKTISSKYHEALKKNGVKKEKFTHYIQMQVYMRKMGLACALYLSVCKDNDEVHAEIVHLDPEVADQYIHRGVQLVFLDKPPERLDRASPGWYKCKFCDHKDVCFDEVAPAFNCRTCEHSRPEQDGTWKCYNPNSIFNNSVLGKEGQEQGCDKYQRLF